MARRAALRKTRERDIDTARETKTSGSDAISTRSLPPPPDRHNLNDSRSYLLMAMISVNSIPNMDSEVACLKPGANNSVTAPSSTPTSTSVPRCKNTCVSGSKSHDSQRRDRILCSFLRSETGQFSPFFEVISSLTYTEHLGKRKQIY